MSWSKICAKQAEEAARVRAKILKFILASKGVESTDLCIKFELTKTPIRTHLEKLREAGSITFTVNPHRAQSAANQRKWHGPGVVPRFDPPKQTMRKGARDFLGRVIVPAAQLGVQGDPFALPTAFFKPSIQSMGAE